MTLSTSAGRGLLLEGFAQLIRDGGHKYFPLGEINLSAVESPSVGGHRDARRLPDARSCSAKVFNG
jgi:hypothetical protein